MRRELEDRLALLERELREVDLQEAAGELDTPTADRLRATYRAERNTTQAELEASPREPAELEERSPRRILVGAGLLVVSFVVVVIAAVSALSEDPTPAPVGSDLSQISNESMLAVIDANQDNPEINAMRLALAERYFEEFDYSAALPQFQAVLDNMPTAPEASEALGRMGWMVHASGASDVAENLLTRSLEARSTNTEASWFLSLVYLDTGRPCEASSILEDLRADATVPIESSADVADVAAAAREACGS